MAKKPRKFRTPRFGIQISLRNDVSRNSSNMKFSVGFRSFDWLPKKDSMNIGKNIDVTISDGELDFDQRWLSMTSRCLSRAFGTFGGTKVHKSITP